MTPRPWPRRSVSRSPASRWATSTKLVSGIAASLDATSRTVTVLIGVAWGAGLLMITLMFVLMIVERRREFATLIAAGAHRRMISRIIIREALAVNALGGIGGIVVSGVLLISSPASYAKVWEGDSSSHRCPLWRCSLWERSRRWASSPLCPRG